MQRRLVPPVAAMIFALGACTTSAPDVPVAEVKPPAATGFVMPEGYHWSRGDAPASREAMQAQFGVASISPNKYRWVDSMPEDGDVRLVVDLKEQLMYAWKGDVLVGAASISSGKEGKETPFGYWTIESKHKRYFSRKYDNAPMPYFQRWDEFGIGVHGGHNPGYPASRGCVRGPQEFAAKLFALTAKGTEVTIEG